MSSINSHKEFNNMNAEIFEIFDLTLEVRCADGTATEFRQTQSELIAQALKFIATPRIFSEPQLAFASDQRVIAFTPHTIDMVLARTTARLPKVLPLHSPAGPVHIRETDPMIPAAHLNCNSHTTTNGDTDTFRVEICTLGGWTNTLEVCVAAHSTTHDKRQTFAHIFDLPSIPFYLATGGIGFINPRNLTRATAYPLPDSLPESALSMEYVRRTSSEPANRLMFA